MEMDTPLKIGMEDKNGVGRKMSFLFKEVDFQVQHVNFPEKNPSKSACQNLKNNFSRSQLPSCPAAQLLINMLIFQGVVSYFLDHSNLTLPDGGGNRCAIADTYWQTETGSHLITPLVGAMVCKPGGQCWMQHFVPVKKKINKVDQDSRPSSRPA